VVVAGVRGFRQRAQEGRDPFRKGMAVGALSGVVALFLHSFLDFNLRGSANALVFCALAGLASAARTPDHLLSRRSTTGLALFLTLAGLAATWRTIGAAELERAATAKSPDVKLDRLGGLVRQHPYLSEAWLERGITWWGLARGNPVLVRLRFQHAVADFEMCVRLRPSWSDAWANLGWMRFLAGDTGGAREAFDRAGELDPTRMSVGLARADFFAALGESDRVVQEAATSLPI